MGYFELVIAHGSGRLWHDYHIAKTQSGDAKATIFGGQILTGERAIGFFHGFVIFGRETLLDPTLKLGAGHHFGLSLAQEVLHFAHIIRTEESATCLNQTPQFSSRSRKSADVVALTAQTHEEIVQRGHDFHALCHEGTLTRTLIIDHSDALIGILL